MASAGAIADSGAVPMRLGDYRLTRERLEGWRGAQLAVDRVPDDPSFLPLRASNATDADVNRAVAYLSSRPDLRRAIEQSGLSVRDYVLTTLALARAEQVRTGARTIDDGVLSADDGALVARFREDFHRGRRLHRFHVVDFGDDDEDDDDDEGGDGHRGHDREHHHGRWTRERDE